MSTLVEKPQALSLPINRWQTNLLTWGLVVLVGLGVGGAAVLGGMATSPLILVLILLVAGMPAATILMGGVRRVMMAAAVFDATFAADIYFNYRTDVGMLSGLGGMNFSVTTACLAVLYAMWLGEMLATHGGPDKARLRSARPLLAYFGMAALSMFVAKEAILTVYELVILIQMLLLYVYLVCNLKTRQDILFFAVAIVLVFAAESVLMIGLRFIGTSIEIGPIFARIDPGNRVGGTVGSPNGAGGYLSLWLPMIFSLALARRKWDRIFLVGTFGLGAVALMFTFSRGGWLGFALGMVIFCVLAVARGWLHPLSLIALTLVVMIILGLLSGVIFERITADDNGAAYSRVPLMEIAFRIIKDYPVLGIGANNFSIVIPTYVSAYSGIWVHTVHNKYLLIWSEIGLGGLLSFLWFLGAAIWQGWRALHTQDRVLSSLAMGLMAGLIGQMAHMMVDIFNDRPQVQAVWMLAALLAALDHLYTNYQGTPTKPPTEVIV